MFWRALAALGAVTFIIGGINVLASGCGSVDFGGTRRSATYSCVESGGELSGGTAGLLMITGGIAVIVWAAWPFIRAAQRRDPW